MAEGWTNRITWLTYECALMPTQTTATTFSATRAVTTSRPATTGSLQRPENSLLAAPHLPDKRDAFSRNVRPSETHPDCERPLETTARRKGFQGLSDFVRAAALESSR
jgi:hypothetical protein